MKTTLNKRFAWSITTKNDSLCVYDAISLSDLLNFENIRAEDSYVTCNGKLVGRQDILQPGYIYHFIPRILGGKGGFGSMLRAIGAQIEKTTNREACRDLSGRRMRDVNNEQKLRDWVKDKAKREREKEEKRKERAEKRKYELTNTRHTFEDQDYHRQKMQVLEELDDAIIQGLQKSSGGASSSSTISQMTSDIKQSRKRKSNRPGPEAMKKACEWLGVDMANLSDLSDSSGSESDGDISDECTSASGSLPQIKEGSEVTLLQRDSGNKSKRSPEATISKPPSTDQGEDSLDNNESEKGKGKGKKSGLLETLSKLPAKDNVTNTEASSDKIGTEKSSDSSKEQSDPAGSTENTTITVVDPTLPVDLDEIISTSQLEELGLDRLKNALMTRGLKCGGTLQQRAERLWSVKGKSKEEIDQSLFAKPLKNKKK